jgi:acyl-CoA synthetase (NDP forming)
MSPVCKMADNGQLAVDQKVKVVLFYAETKSVEAIQRRFREIVRQNGGHIELVLRNSFPAYED